MSVLSWLLIACRIALASIVGAIHERFLPSPTQLRRARASPGRIHLLQVPARQTQSLEPILFPKLRIYFADFPYLHFSIDQRLLTLETCCGYEYERKRKSVFPSDFQGPSRARTGRHRTPQEVKTFIPARRDPSFILPGSRFVGTKFPHVIASARLSEMKKLINTSVWKKS